MAITFSPARFAGRAARVASVGLAVSAVGVSAARADVEALLYSTMPSHAAHRPEMAMDGDENTFFHTAYGMGGRDEFLVLLSAPISVRSIRVETGHEGGKDGLHGALLETSATGAESASFSKAAEFDAAGVAEAKPGGKMVRAIRIKLGRGGHASSLIVREIKIDSPEKISHIQWAPGRGFHDTSQAQDVKDWAERAEVKMEAFWPDTAALLYSYDFITPNMVRVVYRTGPRVTGVAATGGGEMEVNADWCRKHPDDTGLTVHEDAHVVQSMSAYDPVWLIEGTADYIRWVKFEPQNYHTRLNPATATYHDSYRTTASFLGWCELHYDSKLVTKLNEATRVGNFNIGMFKDYCGKDVDTLWSEFIAAYKADPEHIITPPVAMADQPRDLPKVSAAGSKQAVDLSALFDTIGFRRDSSPIAAGNPGLDGEGNTFSSKLLTGTQTSNGVPFTLGKAGGVNAISCKGQIVTLPTQARRSLWLLGTAVEGSKKAQTMTVTYTDGSTETLTQSFSDWNQPQDFPGETQAVSMEYRVQPDGLGEHQPFLLYSYGFPLNKEKTVQSIKLPNEPYVKIFAVTLAN